MLRLIFGFALLSVSAASYANTHMQLEDVSMVREIGQNKIESKACFVKAVTLAETKKQVFVNVPCSDLAKEFKRLYGENDQAGTVEIIMNDNVFFSNKK